MKWRGGAGVVIAVAVAITCAGCTVEETGVLGIQRGLSGELQAVVSMCDGHVDGLTIYHGDTTDWETEFAPPVTATELVDLGEFEALLDPTVESYDVYAWSDDASSSARGPSFTQESVAALQPGDILAYDYTLAETSEAVLDADGWARSVAAACAA